MTRRTAAALLASAALAPVALADWTNSGGNARRNGLATVNGPDGATERWSGSRSSVFAWQPVIQGDRVFVVRQRTFPPETTGSPIVAHDLATGAELWAVNVPAQPGDWTTWIAGVNNGRVFASRSGNAATVSASVYAFDAATGAQVWQSEDAQDAGPLDGAVFAPDGDLVIGSATLLRRVNWEDGVTVWTTPRSGVTAGHCGVALAGDAIYAIDAAVGGSVLRRYDLATGALVYEGPLMPGTSLQNTPFVGPDGTVYVARTQGSTAVDFVYAFTDDGNEIVQRWALPAAWSTASEFAVAADNSVYVLTPGNLLSRVQGSTGAVLTSTPAPIGGGGGLQVRVAVDAGGRVFVSNGQFSTGRLYSFNADLTPRWDVPVTNINVGAPALSSDGTLVVAGTGTNLKAYRTAAPPACRPDLNLDGELTFDDIQLFVLFFSTNDPRADINRDEEITFDDIALFIQLYNAGC
jgi:outer membrane protein assembly factor BamB